MKRYLTLFQANGSKTQFDALDLNNLGSAGSSSISAVYIYVTNGKESAMILRKNYRREYINSSESDFRKCVAIRLLWDGITDNRASFNKRKRPTDDWAENLVDAKWARALVLKEPIKKVNMYDQSEGRRKQTA